MLRAIVIDDEADLRLLARYMVEGSVEVIGEAATAGEALNLVHALVPDIVIVDLNLPDMSGLDLIQLLRADPRPLRLVAYSSDDLALGSALKAGADEAVLKTGEAEPLLKALVA